LTAVNRSGHFAKLEQPGGGARSAL